MDDLPAVSDWGIGMLEGLPVDSQTQKKSSSRLLEAFSGHRSWTLESRKRVMDAIVVGLVKEVLSGLPTLPQESVERCKAAASTDEASSAAAQAADAAVTQAQQGPAGHAMLTAWAVPTEMEITHMPEEAETKLNEAAARAAKTVEYVAMIADICPPEENTGFRSTAEVLNAACNVWCDAARRSPTPQLVDLDERKSLLAIPIDFEALIADGVLAREGEWYRILDYDRVPKHVWVQVGSAATGEDGLVRFRFPGRL